MSGTAVILLAAGQSRRMEGRDKLMESVDGIPLLRRSALRAMDVGPVVVALPPTPHPRFDALDGLDVQAVEVPDADEGMNASLRCGLLCVPSDARAAMVLLADLPELTAGDLITVRQSVYDNPDKLIWRGATSDGKPGHPVVFDRSLFPHLSRLTGDGGAQSVVRAHRDRLHLERLPNQHALLDLDTPDDWARWRAGQSE